MYQFCQTHKQINKLTNKYDGTENIYTVRKNMQSNISAKFPCAEEPNSQLPQEFRWPWSSMQLRNSIPPSL